MIVGFGNRATDDLYNGVVSKHTRHLPAHVVATACRKLDMVNSAISVEDLRSPPGNHLEALRGDLAGYHSVRINGQYRIVFKFLQGNAHEVRITDYH